MDKTLQEEKNHLISVITLLKEVRKTLEDSIQTLGAGAVSRLKELRENPEGGMDLLFFMEQLQQKHESFNVKDKFKRIEEFKSLIKEPYFARIDLSDKENNLETYYIGKFGFTAKIPVITDWRAAVSSVYYRYRYPQKNVEYVTPQGKETADLKLKRTFEIDEGALDKYYNNDIQLDENDIIIDKISKRTGGVLEDIVETIQKSQLDIIQSDPRQVCIVQGCVGSGKSTVAVHKLSHIFFNFPNLIHSERSILIAKNQILVGYLSTLFPKLGIFDLNYGTLKDMIIRVFFKENIKLSFNFDNEQENLQVDSQFISNITGDVKNLHSKYEDLINKLFSKRDYESFGGYVYDNKVSVVENIKEIIIDLEEEVDSQNSFTKDPAISSYMKEFHKENLKTLRAIIRELRLLANKAKTTDLGKLTKDYYGNSAVLGYKDALIYAYFYSEIAGLSHFLKYEYCVIDEGQDFNLLEYLVIDKVVINGRLCVFGDLNQNISNEGLTGWDEIINTVKSTRNASMFELHTNYRSTRPIIDLANKIMQPFTDTYLPVSINRKGSNPNFVASTNFFEDFQTEIAGDVKDLDKSIGIICMNEETFLRAKTILSKLELKKEYLIVLDSKNRISYIPKGVYLTLFENCKGLEFGKVYILDLNFENISTFIEAKKAFVSVTRAMNEVSVYCNVDEDEKT